MNRELKTIIVDDEPGCINRLLKDLTNYPYINVVDTALSGTEAKDTIIKQRPDLLFLDIEMPDADGIDLLREIYPYCNKEMCVVFYSAHNEHVVKAFRNSAFDFLLKPYLKDELELIMNRVKEKHRVGCLEFNDIIRQLSIYDKGFNVQTSTGVLRLRSYSVLYFKYENKKWNLVMADQNRTTYELRSTTKAKDILELYSSFFRIDQSYIINLDYLLSVEKMRKCVMQPPFSDLNFEVSLSNYSDLKKKFITI